MSKTKTPTVQLIEAAALAGDVADLSTKLKLANDIITAMIPELRKATKKQVVRVNLPKSQAIQATYSTPSGEIILVPLADKPVI